MPFRLQQHGEAIVHPAEHVAVGADAAIAQPVVGVNRIAQHGPQPPIVLVDAMAASGVVAQGVAGTHPPVQIAPQYVDSDQNVAGQIENRPSGIVALSRP